MGDFQTEEPSRAYTRICCRTPHENCPHYDEHGFKLCPTEQWGFPDCFTPHCPLKLVGCPWLGRKFIECPEEYTEYCIIGKRAQISFYFVWKEFKEKLEVF